MVPTTHRNLCLWTEVEIRCRIFFACILISSKNVLRPAATISPAKPYLQKKSFFLPCFHWIRNWRSSKETCVMNCTEKFIKHSERVGARFAEQNAGMSLLSCMSTSTISYASETMNPQNQSWTSCTFSHIRYTTICCPSLMESLLKVIQPCLPQNQYLLLLDYELWRRQWIDFT